MFKPMKKDNLILHAMSEELLIYDPEQDRSHRLNGTATMIWNCCNGVHDAEAIARQLADCYEVEYESALQDTHHTLERFAEEKIVKESTEQNRALAHS